MTKISSLTAQTTAASTDNLAIVDNSGTPTTKKITWANLIKSIISQAKGNIPLSDGTTIGALTVGSNNQVLTADSAQTYGVKWATPATGGQSGDMMYPLNVTIGDYTSPNAATATSTATGADTTLHSQTQKDATYEIIGHTYQRAGQEINTSHALIGQNIYKCTFWLQKNGSPTGTASLIIRSSADVNKGTLGTIDVSTISTSEAAVTIGSGAVVVTIAAGDRISLEYSGGDASNNIRVFYKNSDVDANSNWSMYNGVWNDAATADFYFVAIGSGPFSASFVYDTSTTTHWKSNSEANPAIYVDLSGSARDIASIALNINKTATTETAIKIRCSTDTSFSSGETVRTINISDFTDDTWRFIPINRLAADCRYVQIYGSSGSTVTLSINEIKVYYAPTTTDWNRKHFHKYLDPTSTSDNTLDSN